MNELSNEELTQLVNFYRQRASELELQVLQMQLKLGKVSSQKDSSKDLNTDSE